LIFTPYLWVFAESFFYYRRMHRRLSLGLADAVTTNRFLLFAIWTGGVVAITLLGLIGTALAQLGGTGFREQELFSNATILTLTRIVTLPVAVSIWLSFFPPTRYCRWLEQRALALAAD
jgi:predicted membrane chloride channel (bestrophin family)